MEVELQSRAKIREIERETAHLRLLSAAERADRREVRAARPFNGGPGRATPLKLLRALRPAS